MGVDRDRLIGDYVTVPSESTISRVMPARSGWALRCRSAAPVVDAHRRRHLRAVPGDPGLRLLGHECDITTPLGRVTDDAGVAAEIALAEVESSIGYIVGKKVGLPDRKSIAFCLTGPLVRELDVIVDGRAKQVDHLDDPDVVLTTDSTTFIQPPPAGCR